MPETAVEEQTWNPPAWDQVADEFREAFPEIDPGEIRRRYEGARELGQWRYRLRGAEETTGTAFLRSTDPFGILADVSPFLCLLAMLLVRPWGLFGTKEELERV